MGAFKDLLNLSPGTNTAEAIVKEGVDIVRKLRGRAKINYFYTGARQSFYSKERHELLEQTFGNSLTRGQCSRFRYLTHYLDRLAKPGYD